jgi:hypothetical protein
MVSRMMASQFRRMYVYLICAVSLAVIAVGLVNVLEIAVVHVWGLISDARQFDESATEVRQRLSLYLALTGVGLPIFLLHWYLAERWASDQEVGDRGSDVRGLYFTAVLTVTLFVVLTSLISIIESSLARAIGEPVFINTRDGIMAVLTIIVVTAAWSLHAWMRHRDTRLIQIPNSASAPVFLYLYGATFLGLMFMLSGVAELLSMTLRTAVDQGFGIFAFDWLDYPFASATARIFGGGLIWGLHWAYSLNTLGDTGWRGQSERGARLRPLYLFGSLSIAVVVTLVSTSFALSEVLQWLFGVDRTGRDLPVAAYALQSLGIALPFGLLWWYHRRRIVLETASIADEDVLTSVTRLHRYIVAFVALVLGSIGLGYLAGVTLEFMFGAVGFGEGVSIWDSEEASVFAALMLVGFAIWLPRWVSIQRAVMLDRGTESQATSRRAYLYLVLSFSTLALLAALATLLYQVFQEVLGVRETPGLAGDVAVLLGVSLVATVFLAYHLRLLLLDTRLVVSGQPESEASLQGPVEPAAHAQLRLVLSGPDTATLRSVLGEMRRQLPDSVHLIEVEAEKVDEQSDATDQSTGFKLGGRSPLSPRAQPPEQPGTNGG